MLSDSWWRCRKIGPTADREQIPEYTKLREDHRHEIVRPDFTSLPGFQVRHQVPQRLCGISLCAILKNENMYTSMPGTGEFGIRMIDPTRPVDHQPILSAPFVSAPGAAAGFQNASAPISRNGRRPGKRRPVADTPEAIRNSVLHEIARLKQQLRAAAGGGRQAGGRCGRAVGRTAIRA